MDHHQFQIFGENEEILFIIFQNLAYKTFILLVMHCDYLKHIRKNLIIGVFTMKISQTKIKVVFGLLLFILPIIFTPFAVNALESNQPVQNLLPNNGVQSTVKSLISKEH